MQMAGRAIGHRDGDEGQGYGDDDHTGILQAMRLHHRSITHWHALLLVPSRYQSGAFTRRFPFVIVALARADSRILDTSSYWN